MMSMFKIWSIEQAIPQEQQGELYGACSTVENPLPTAEKEILHSECLACNTSIIVLLFDALSIMIAIT